ncbi:MAG: c-type cytochrome biogenesis protein CcsB [Candidatus Omnitrophota bacterium]
MTEFHLLSAAGVLYLGCFFAYAVLFFKREPSSRFAFAIQLVICAALLLQGAALVLRTVATGHAPFTNMYESLVFFSWCLAFAWLCAEQWIGLARLGFLMMALTVAVLMYAFSHDASVKPLMPALQSNWLVLHVTTCFLSYGAFAVSFVTSIVFLSPAAKKVSTPEKLDLLIYKLILFGFPMLTLGIASGAVWANDAWGVYWSWDPKETWALITWLIYALYLHLRLMQGWTGRRLAWVAFAGFLSVLFTYLGVAYLLPGLHSYA